MTDCSGQRESGRTSVFYLYSQQLMTDRSGRQRVHQSQSSSPALNSWVTYKVKGLRFTCFTKTSLLENSFCPTGKSQQYKHALWGFCLKTLSVSLYLSVSLSLSLYLSVCLSVSVSLSLSLSGHQWTDLLMKPKLNGAMYVIGMVDPSNLQIWHKINDHF